MISAIFFVDANIVCVPLPGSGRPASGQRHRLVVSGEFNMPMNGDRSIPLGILLDRVLIDAFERQFPGIRPFGLVETSIEVVVVDFNARGSITHNRKHAPEAARFGNVYDGLDTRRSTSRDRRCREVERPDTKKGFILSGETGGHSKSLQLSEHPPSPSAKWRATATTAF
jgi:hypothetical protein